MACIGNFFKMVCQKLRNNNQEISRALLSTNVIFVDCKVLCSLESHNVKLTNWRSVLVRRRESGMQREKKTKEDGESAKEKGRKRKNQRGGMTKAKYGVSGFLP